MIFPPGVDNSSLFWYLNFGILIQVVCKKIVQQADRLKDSNMVVVKLLILPIEDDEVT